MKILVDSREKGSKEERIKTGYLRCDRAKYFYEQKGHEALIRTLPYGDYVFEDKIVYEYKEIHDYMISLNNGSLFEEAVNQAKRYDYHYVVIVGNVQDYIDDTWKLPIVRRAWQHDYQKFIRSNIGGYKGSIRRLREFTCPIFCKSEEEALNEMLLQSIKCLNPKLYGGTKRKIYSNDIVTHTISGSNNVGDKLIKNIRETHEVNCLQELLKLSVEDLKKVPKIGDKTAQVIYDWVHQGEDLIEKE